MVVSRRPLFTTLILVGALTLVISVDSVGQSVGSTLSLTHSGAWSPLGAGVNGEVRALAHDAAGKLYVAGDFTAAGDVSSLDVAMWDGGEWNALGEGFLHTGRVGQQGRVNALLVDPAGRLYAGGEFDRAGGVPANNVALWDGSSWSALGAGTDLHVDALALDEAGNLYIGGAFSFAGEAPAHRIAMWDGETWHGLGTGVTSPEDVVDASVVSAMAIDASGDVIVGGRFSHAGGEPAANVARWDGESWHPIGGGFTGGQFNVGVNALAVGAAGTIYAGGSLPEAGGVETNNIARWDGDEWIPLGAGIPDGRVSAISVRDANTVFVGGNFTRAGSTSISNIALWDGTGWNGFGPEQFGFYEGVNGDVNALTTDTGGRLYAGGRFVQAGLMPANRVAMWTPEESTRAPRADELPAIFQLSAAYPNPFNPRTQFDLTLGASRHVVVSAYDAYGRRVQLLHDGVLTTGTHLLSWDARGLASGAYLIRVTAGDAAAGLSVTLAK